MQVKHLLASGIEQSVLRRVWPAAICAHAATCIMPPKQPQSATCSGNIENPILITMLLLGEIFTRITTVSVLVCLYVCGERQMLGNRLVQNISYFAKRKRFDSFFLLSSLACLSAMSDILSLGCMRLFTCMYVGVCDCTFQLLQLLVAQGLAGPLAGS